MHVSHSHMIKYSCIYTIIIYIYIWRSYEKNKSPDLGLSSALIRFLLEAERESTVPYISYHPQTIHEDLSDLMD